MCIASTSHVCKLIVRIHTQSQNIAACMLHAACMHGICLCVSLVSHYYSSVTTVLGAN